MTLPTSLVQPLLPFVQDAAPPQSSAGPLDRLGDLSVSGVTLLGMAGLVVLAWLSLYVARGIILRGVHRITEKTRFTWDDTLRDNRVFHRIAHVAPALVVYYGIALVAGVPDPVVDVVQRVATAFLVVMLVAAAHASLSAANAIYVAEYEHAASRPIKGYLQIVSLVLWIAGGIVT
ncbi:MAG: hypothetical protein PVI57_09995, partial [Gemmatimonadota bacterium]